MTLTLNKGFWTPADSGDPYWDDVFYLFQAPDSGSSLTDSSDSGFTITAQDSCAPSTTYTLFQSQSLFLASAHTGTQASADIRSGSSLPSNWTFPGDLTVEMWSYLPDSTKGSSSFLELIYSGGSCGFGWVFAAEGDTNGSSQIYDNVQICGGTFYKSYTGTIDYDEWNYMAWVRSGSGSNNNKLYSGISTDTSTTLRGQWTNTATYGSSSPTELIMGGGSTQGFYVDSIRVTKGVARDVSSIPTSAFPTS
jgi:hypothetical protein